jgi:hypothetical protein
VVAADPLGPPAPPSVGNLYCGLVLVVAADPLGPSAPPSVGNPYCGLVQGVHDYVAIYGIIDILTLCCACMTILSEECFRWGNTEMSNSAET